MKLGGGVVFLEFALGGGPNVSEQTEERVARLCRFADMSERAEACRKKASQCEHAAIVATDMGARFMYLEIARQWRDMAEQAEDLDQRFTASRERQ